MPKLVGMARGFRERRHSSDCPRRKGRNSRIVCVIQFIPQRPQTGIGGDPALADPQQQATDQHTNHHHIEQRPQDFQRHAAVIPEMQGARDFEEAQVPRHGIRPGQFARAGIDQNRECPIFCV